MTVHAVEVVSSPNQKSSPSDPPQPEPPDPAPALRDRFTQNVFGTLTEALSEQASPMARTNTEMDGSGTDHVRGTYRLDGSHTKTEVLDEVETAVVSDMEWYEVRYHDCPHDAENPGACPDWTAERSGGTVPSDV